MDFKQFMGLVLKFRKQGVMVMLLACKLLLNEPWTARLSLSQLTVINLRSACAVFNRVPAFVCTWEVRQLVGLEALCRGFGGASAAKSGVSETISDILRNSNVRCIDTR